MPLMMNFRLKPARGAPPPEGRGLKRLEFEMALEIGDSGTRTLAELVRETTEAVGGDLAFVLPASDGTGESALVRLVEDGRSCFVQISARDSGLTIIDEGEIEADMLGFARTALTLLERLRADHTVMAPLASGG